MGWRRFLLSQQLWRALINSLVLNQNSFKSEIHVTHIKFQLYGCSSIDLIVKCNKHKFEIPATCKMSNIQNILALSQWIIFLILFRKPFDT